MPEEQVEFPVIWVGVEDAPVHMANQMLSQFEEDQFYVTFGQLTPPVLLGSPEQMRDQAKRLGYVPVKVISRLSLTPRRMREFIEVLQRNLASYEQKHRREQQ